MKDLKQIAIDPNTPILRAIEVIDASALQIAIVVDENGCLLGTVTDGDIRRAIIKGVDLNSQVELVMNSRPTVARLNDGREGILRIMKLKKLHHIPVLDESDRVVGIEFLDELIQDQARDNCVVLMAGGMGSRLRPLTNECPKPLLRVGDKPILETILENFSENGFRDFFISINYKADLVEQYFGDGSKWGINVTYLREDKKLGTAGALGLMPTRPNKPLIVMNGDILTKVNFQQLLDFHQEHAAAATMCVREYEFQVPYGVVKLDNNRLVGIEEKPWHRSFVSAGIYVLDPEVLNLIPSNEYFDMPSLFEKLLSQQMETAVFPIHEYWLDIGKMDDFERANGDYAELFS